MATDQLRANQGSQIITFPLFHLFQLDYCPWVLQHISSRLDHCNALYVGLTKSSISRLRLGQNAAALFWTGFWTWTYFPVLASLHWLPVHFTIDFKLLCLFLMLLTAGLSPLLLVRDFNPPKPWQGSSFLRSAPPAGSKVETSAVGWWILCGW